MKLTNKQQAVLILIFGTLGAIVLQNVGWLSADQQQMLVYAIWGGSAFYGGGDVLYDVAGRIFGNAFPDVLENTTNIFDKIDEANQDNPLVTLPDNKTQPLPNLEEAG